MRSDTFENPINRRHIIRWKHRNRRELTADRWVIFRHCSPHRRMPSYIEYITAALGTTRIRCADKPPYNDLAPSSFKTSLKVWSRPVYFTLPLMSGCRKRVRNTFRKESENEWYIKLLCTYLVSWYQFTNILAVGARASRRTFEC